MSQQANYDTISNTLVHDVFTKGVAEGVRWASPTSALYKDRPAGRFTLEGAKCKFAARLEFAPSGVATDGTLPNYQGSEPVIGELNAARRYQRIAFDNLTQLRASGEGAYEALEDWVFDQMWEGWERMDTRHSVGPSSGVVGVVQSRSSSTVFVIGDAFGNTGSNPINHIVRGDTLCWWDISGSPGIDGAGVVASVNPATNAVTMDDAATWEPGDNIAAGDLIYFASANSISADNFIAERNLAPNGVGTILDPTASLSTVFNIAESGNERWKPYREPSVNFDTFEVTGHWRRLGVKRGVRVTPQTDVCITHPSVVEQAARTITPFQQQSNLGGEMHGGWTAIRIANMDIEEDPRFYHNVLATFYKDSLYRVGIGGNADFFDEDGSMWQRETDFDGKDAYVREYMNFVCDQRGFNGALTGIVTPDVTASGYDAVPNY